MDSDPNPIPDDTGDVMEEAELVDLANRAESSSSFAALSSSSSSSSASKCSKLSLEAFGFTFHRDAAASAASASFSSNSSSIPSSSLSVSSSSVSSSSSSVSSSSVSSSSSSGFSSYPNIENFVSVVSQIEFVDPVSVLGWTNADVWKVHLVAVSKLELQYDAKTNSNKRKVRCMLCTSKIWEKWYQGPTNVLSHLRNNHSQNSRVKELSQSTELVAASRWEEQAVANNKLIQVCMRSVFPPFLHPGCF